MGRYFPDNPVGPENCVRFNGLPRRSADIGGGASIS
jgi:hypothetical protein